MKKLSIAISLTLAGAALGACDEREAYIEESQELREEQSERREAYREEMKELKQERQAIEEEVQEEAREGAGPREQAEERMEETAEGTVQKTNQE